MCYYIFNIPLMLENIWQFLNKILLSYSIRSKGRQKVGHEAGLEAGKGQAREDNIYPGTTGETGSRVWKTTVYGGNRKVSSVQQQQTYSNTLSNVFIRSPNVPEWSVYIWITCSTFTPLRIHTYKGYEYNIACWNNWCPLVFSGTISRAPWIWQRHRWKFGSKTEELNGGSRHWNSSRPNWRGLIYSRTPRAPSPATVIQMMTIQPKRAASPPLPISDA